MPEPFRFIRMVVSVSIVVTETSKENMVVDNIHHEKVIGGRKFVYELLSTATINTVTHSPPAIHRVKLWSIIVSAQP